MLACVSPVDTSPKRQDLFSWLDPRVIVNSLICGLELPLLATKIHLVGHGLGLVIKKNSAFSRISSEMPRPTNSCQRTAAGYALELLLLSAGRQVSLPDRIPGRPSEPPLWWQWSHFGRRGRWWNRVRVQWSHSRGTQFQTHWHPQEEKSKEWLVAT